MARIYTDENISYRLVEAIRLLGHDVLTAHEAGQANQRIPDPAVLSFAIAAGRVLLTHNRPDFRRLHALMPRHHGIIACTRDDDATALAVRVHQAINDNQPLAGKFIRVYRPATP